ncbi:hypothetical protein, partial [Dyella japonica]|uniref:hypothetical protein n=1 Tax=Dyella japonica TaxID=231455 RepID=UPI001B80C56B
MERIKGKPAFEYIKSKSSLARPQIVDAILDALKFSTDTYFVSPETVRRDFTKEFYTKVIDRCESIQPLIDSFGKITHVNYTKIGHLKPMLKQALEHLIRYHNRSQGQYSVIHGDPNFSNTMIT